MWTKYRKRHLDRYGHGGDKGGWEGYKVDGYNFGVVVVVVVRAYSGQRHEKDVKIHTAGDNDVTV